MGKIFNSTNQEFVEIECTKETVGLNTKDNFNFMNFSVDNTTALQTLYMSNAWLYRSTIYMDKPVISVSKSGTLKLENNIDYSLIETMDENKILTSKYSINGNLEYGNTNTIVKTTDFNYRNLQFIDSRLIPVAITYNGNIIAAGILYIIFMQFPTYMTEKTISFTSNYIYNGIAYNVNYHGITINPTELEYREADVSNDIEQGGGYGTGTMPADNISIPALPAINMSDTGATLYSLNALQMKAFRSWLWSSDWQDNIKKIRNDPMQNIIGISITDVPISSGLNALIYVGNVASTVEANVISNAFVEVDCGTISLNEYYGTFADYEPFCATTLFLPKVGFVQIPADACVNNTIHVIYHIELSSGEGLCYVILTSKRDNVSYIWNTYTCHVNSNVTLSAQDHTQQLVALSNAIINTTTTAAGAVANPSVVPSAVASIASNCLNVATTKNPTQTKGNIGNMSAIMCYKKPYLLINRTNLAKPSSFQENNGYLINYTAKIQGHTGFLKTRDYHCEFNAPYNHRAEIERLLDTGVIINA